MARRNQRNEVCDEIRVVMNMDIPYQGRRATSQEDFPNNQEVFLFFLGYPLPRMDVVDTF